MRELQIAGVIVSLVIGSYVFWKYKRGRYSRTVFLIGMALSMRTLNQDLRDMGTIKGTNKPFDKKDRSRFLSALDEMVQ